MPSLPLVKVTKAKRELTDKFLGLNKNPRIKQSEFSHMENLTSSYYPLLSCRDSRGELCRLSAPQGIYAKSKLIWVDGGELFIAGEKAEGISLSQGEKSLVSMGAYLLIFPDRIYVNCEEPSDFGSIDARFETQGEVKFSLCALSAQEYDSPEPSPEPPENPQNGMLWIDSSSAVHSLKQYSAANEMWVSLEGVYTKIQNPGIGRDFAQDDAVEISGCHGSEELAALNGLKLIEKRGEDFILVQGMLSAACVQSEGTVKICRTMPEMDFVTEAENRLWGCKYGMVDGKSVNEIYGCALGDFKNWRRYQGLADDSYAASLGSDGPFTAACTHLGYPIFFKENCLHKLYISADGAHRIVDSSCPGVEKGSHKSLQSMGSALMYKSALGVYAYEGSVPRCISQALGEQSYKKAAAGALGDKYFLSMEDEKGESSLLVYDSAKALWHREDNLKALGFAGLSGELFCLDEKGRVLAMEGSVGEREEDFNWQAISGILGYERTGRSYLSRLILRLSLPVGSEADVLVEYDSSGSFSHAAHIRGCGTGSFSLPISPQRCDHFRLMLTGKGSFRLYSMEKIIEQGSDY